MFAAFLTKGTIAPCRSRPTSDTDPRGNASISGCCGKRKISSCSARQAHLHFSQWASGSAWNVAVQLSGSVRQVQTDPAALALFLSSDLLRSLPPAVLHIEWVSDWPFRFCDWPPIAALRSATMRCYAMHACMQGDYLPGRLKVCGGGALPSAQSAVNPLSFWS